MGMARLVGALLVLAVGAMMSPGPVRAQPVDLTGTWQDERSALYRVRQIGDRVFWSSEALPARINVFVGSVAGNTVTGDWVDLPGGQQQNAGRLVLRIESPDRMVRVEASPISYAGDVWSRVGGGAPPAVAGGAPPPGTGGAAPASPARGGSADAVPPPPPEVDAAWRLPANSRAPARDGVPVAFPCPAGMNADVLTRRGVWGTDIYTADSIPCLAAVHAGLITRETGGTVTIIFAAGQNAYAASARNGVSSEAWQEFARSFVFVRPDGTAIAVIPTPARASAFNPREHLPERRAGERYLYWCPPGITPGSVWGSDIYTDDSRVCTAAIHAGRATPAAGGAVIIEMRPGLGAYQGTTRNSVTTDNFGPFDSSFVFVGPPAPLPTTVAVGPGGALVPGGGPLPPGTGGAAPEITAPPPGSSAALPPGGGGSGGSGGSGAALPPGGGGPCANPRLLQVMDEWLARAIPPLDGTWRYEPWGRAVGRGPKTIVTAPVGRPDTNLNRCDYLLRQATGLPSRNLGTLYDYLKANGVL